MKDIQERVLDRIDSLCNEFDVVASVSHDYPNTGSVYISSANLACTFIIIDFVFQSRYVSLNIRNGHKEILYDFQMLDYTDLLEFFHALSTVLKEATE